MVTPYFNLKSELAKLPAYGLPGTSLIPRVLEPVWEKERLAEMLALQFGLPVGATIIDLNRRYALGEGPDNSVWSPNDFTAARRFIERFANSRCKSSNVQKMLLVNGPWNPLLNANDIPWSTRLKNGFVRGGLGNGLEIHDHWGRLRFSDLTKIEGLGISSLLEFAVMLEWALAIANAISPPTRTDIQETTPMRDADVPEVQMPEHTDYFAMPITELNLGTRATNALLANHIDSVGDLANRSASDLFRLQNFGKTSFLLTEKALASWGLSLEAGLERLIESHPIDVNSPVSEAEKETVEAELSLLSKLQEKPWASQISPTDPLLQALIPLNSAHTIDELLEGLFQSWEHGRLSATQRHLVHIISSSIDAIATLVEANGALTLEESASRLFDSLSGSTEPKRSVLLKRLGWAGEKAITLQQAGDELGVTRERVRQIQAEFELKLRRLFDTRPVYFPQLVTACRLLEENSPIDVMHAGKLLRDAGLSQQLFSPHSLFSLAEALGVEHTLRIQSVRGRGQMVVVDGDNRILAFGTRARKLAGANGIANINDLIDVLKMQDNVEINVEEARSFLTDSDEFKLVEDDWFWWTSVKPERDRLRNIVRSMLSVISPLEVPELRRGVHRTYKHRSISSHNYGSDGNLPLRTPSVIAIRAYLKAHPEFNLDNNEGARSVQPLNYVDEIGENARGMVDALRASPAGILDRASWEADSIARGVNRSTFSVFTTYSPHFTQLALNVWGLRGAKIGPEVIQAYLSANAQRPTERRQLDYGWTENGRIWMTIRMPEWSHRMVQGIPGSLTRFFIHKEFHASGETGENYGVLKVSEHQTLYNFHSFVNKCYPERDDVLRLEFDMQNASVIMTLSDPEAFHDQ